MLSHSLGRWILISHNATPAPARKPRGPLYAAYLPLANPPAWFYAHNCLRQLCAPDFACGKIGACFQSCKRNGLLHTWWRQPVSDTYVYSASLRASWQTTQFCQNKIATRRVIAHNCYSAIMRPRNCLTAIPGPYSQAAACCPGSASVQYGI
jgi:hypothetical protein